MGKDSFCRILLNAISIVDELDKIHKEIDPNLGLSEELKNNTVNDIVKENISNFEWWKAIEISLSDLPESEKSQLILEETKRGFWWFLK